MRSSFHDLNRALHSIEVEEHGYRSVLEFLKVVRQTAQQHRSNIFFIGNGGSAAIASHMAADWQKNGKMPTMCFNDGAALTCLSNDLGYENVFSEPLKHHARLGDLLIAISSSGESESILFAVEVAREQCLNIVTLSGFDPENSLRGRGGVNFYVPSRSYGTVEIAHLAILHSILDEVISDKG